MHRWLLNLYILLFALSASAEIATFEITFPGTNHRSFLVGTIHFGVNMQELPNHFLRSVREESQLLVTETHFDDFQSLRYYPPGGRTLVDDIGPSAYTKLLSYTAEHYSDYEVMRMKPGLAFQFIMRNIILEEPKSSPSMDYQLWQWAKVSGMEREGFVSGEEHLKAREKTIDAESSSRLVDFLSHGMTSHQIRNHKHATYEGREHYRQGNSQHFINDAKALQKLDPDFFNKVLIERNELWLPTLMDHHANGSALFAVGFMHLFGEKGIIDLLRKNGYEVNALSGCGSVLD